MKNLKKNSGFTLLEIMVSLSIFMVVMTISMGAILNVYDANRKSRAESAVMGNLNLAVETMTREMRFGRNYHCGSTGVLTNPQNCASGGNYMSFLSSEGVQIIYRQSGTLIEKSTSGGAFLAVTAPEVRVESLEFFVLGSTIEATGSEQQPRVLIKIKGNAGEKAIARSEFALQTLVSQRRLDNGL
ncbi:MAG: type II secretion system protein [Parcubacteria group bacterium]